MKLLDLVTTTTFYDVFSLLEWLALITSQTFYWTSEVISNSTWQMEEERKSLGIGNECRFCVVMRMKLAVFCFLWSKKKALLACASFPIGPIPTPNDCGWQEFRSFFFHFSFPFRSAYIFQFFLRCICHSYIGSIKPQERS